MHSTIYIKCLGSNVHNKNPYDRSFENNNFFVEKIQEGEGLRQPPYQFLLKYRDGTSLFLNHTDRYKSFYAGDFSVLKKELDEKKDSYEQRLNAANKFFDQSANALFTDIFYTHRATFVVNKYCLEENISEADKSGPYIQNLSVTETYDASTASKVDVDYLNKVFVEALKSEPNRCCNR